jgi:prepilin-type N-terminal cleavage/methylation domain-containing protein
MFSRFNNGQRPAVTSQGSGDGSQISAFCLLPSAFRPAFTLIELLVVITIIGILAGLASVAAYKVFVTARGAAIKADITNLESALEKYKMDHGDYPPSNMYDVSLIRRHLLKKFPKCNVDFEMQYIPDKLGVIVADAAITTPYGSRVTLSNANAMNPAQALVFWLQGFCADKQRPLSAAYSASPAERTAVLDFNKSRIVDPNSKQAWVASAIDTASPYLPLTAVPPPVYMASAGEQPFVYFDARSYLWHAIDPNLSPEGVVPYLLEPWDINTPSNSTLDITNVGSGRELLQDGSSNIIATSYQKLCANPKSFQILSAGVDGDFGKPVGGQKKELTSIKYNNVTGFTLVYKSYPTGLGYAGDGEDDNYTNFSDRALGDAKPE